MIEIRHRTTGAVIQSVDADTLRYADLRYANLQGADLQGADLRYANLWGADLQGADLRGANLWGAVMNWQNHDLLAELLRHEAGDDVQKRCLAGLVLLSRDWCWKEFLAIEHPEKDWALRVLVEAAAAQPEGSFIPEDLKPMPALCSRSSTS